MSAGGAIIARTGRPACSAAGAEPVLVARVVHRHVERLALVPHVAHVDGDEAEALGHLARDQVEELARELDVEQRHPRHAELVREDLGELRLVDQPALHEQRAEAPPVRALQARTSSRAAGEIIRASTRSWPRRRRGVGIGREVSPTRESGTETPRDERDGAPWALAGARARSWTLRAEAGTALLVQRRASVVVSAPCRRSSARSAVTPASRATSSARVAASRSGSSRARPTTRSSAPRSRAATSSSSSSASAAWAASTAPSRRPSVARSRSRSSTRTCSAKRAPPPASSPRRAPRAASTTRTRSPSSTSARTAGSSTSSWSTCAGKDLARVAYEEGFAPLPAHRRRPGADARRARRGAPPRHHPPRSQAREHHPRADALRRRLREGRRLRPREDEGGHRRADPASPAPASSAARPTTWRPSRAAAIPSTRAATSTRSASSSTSSSRAACRSRRRRRRRSC